MMEVDREKFEKRYVLTNHARGIILGILITIFVYEVIL